MGAAKKWARLSVVAVLWTVPWLTLRTEARAVDRLLVVTTETGSTSLAALPQSGTSSDREQAARNEHKRIWMRTRTPNLRVYVRGVRLAFVLNRPVPEEGYRLGAGGQELWLTEYGQRSPVRLLPNGDPRCPTGIRQPQFSPDGRRILFRAPSPGQGPRDPGDLRSGLWVVDIGTRSCRFVADDKGYGRLEWLPDNHQILTEAESPAEGLRVLDTHTKRARALPHPKGTDFLPAWTITRDGAAVVYEEQQKSRMALIAQPVDGSPARCLGYIPDAVEPRGYQAPTSLAIAPDGRRLAVIGVGGLTIATLNGRVLSRWKEWGDDVTWSPDGRYVALYSESQAVSPDGEELVGFGSSEVRVIDTLRRTITSCLRGGFGPDHRGPVLAGATPAAAGFVGQFSEGNPFLWWPTRGGAHQALLFGPDTASDVDWWSSPTASVAHARTPTGLPKKQGRSSMRLPAKPIK